MRDSEEIEIIKGFVYGWILWIIIVVVFLS
jgi:hypothetical protein